MLINPFILSDVVLLLHCDGADGSTDFPDATDSRHSVTAGGNAQVDTAQSVFGGGSALFAGSGDFLTVPDSEEWNLWGANSTIDLRVRFSILPLATQSAGLCSQISADAGWVFRVRNVAGQLIIELAAVDGATTVGLFSADVSLSVDTWYHFAVERYGDDTNFYIDGVKQTTVVDTAWGVQPDVSAILTVGSKLANLLNGWIDELRISKGIARYEGNNFTPETAEYA